MVIPVNEVQKIIEDAIINRKVLLVQYQHADDKNIVLRKMAPFDIGNTNPKYSEAFKDNAYMFCYDHYDYRLQERRPIVHPIRIDLITSIKLNGQVFDEKELADIHLKNTGYDYRTSIFAILPDRNWFGRY
jgi:hypothetical protein